MQQSPEISIEQKSELTESGFSEKRAARLIEGVQKDNSQVKKTRMPRKIKLPTFRKKQITKQPISRRDKI